MRLINKPGAALHVGFLLLLLLNVSACKKTTEAPEPSSKDAIAATQPVELKASPSPTTSVAISPTSKCEAAPNSPGASNSWGFPDLCECPATFSYNPVSGLCDGYEPIPAGSKLVKNTNISDFVPPGACTNDLNEWANPSSCDCPPRSRYNPVSARCDAKK